MTIAERVFDVEDEMMAAGSQSAPLTIGTN